MVGAVQVSEHLLLANDGTVSLFGHQVLTLVVLFGNLFVVLLGERCFAILLDIGSECCVREKKKQTEGALLEEESGGKFKREASTDGRIRDAGGVR